MQKIPSTTPDSVETDWSFLRRKNGSHCDNTNNAVSLTNTNSSPAVPVGPNPRDDYYNMQHPGRGLALIFCHKNFYSPLKCSPRYGTEVDRENLKKMFIKLKFDVRVHDDLGVSEIMEELDNVSKVNHSQFDCLVVTVMTHGTNSKLYASDGYYDTKKLWSYFTARNCPSLAAKPKLFFIQACRGKMTDPGVSIQFETDSLSEKPSEKFYSIPIMADILIMYATVEGYYAWRDLEKGSCFIQSLVTQLEKHHDKKDLLTILTFVNRQVAIEFVSHDPKYEEFHAKKEMCSIVSMLTRILYFQ